MPRAILNETVIAESDCCHVVEGNVYFPPDSVNPEFLRPTQTTTVCGWKGTASYYTLAVGGLLAADAAWTYRDPKPAARNIKDHIAFYPVVRVEP